MNVCIVGPGRLGRSLAVLFAPLYDVTTVGRDLSLPKHSDVVLLTVPDHAVAEVAQAVPQGPVVLHCAGALDLDVLAPHQRRGSFHPLMTFPGPELGLPDPSDVPVALAGEPEALGVARRLADDVGMRAFEVPGDRRLYHAAAVIAGNLAMVLMDEAATVLEHAGVGREVAFDVLTPLALRSVNNAALGLPQALTGPIARSDQTTLDGHRAALQAHHPAALPFYEALVERAIARLSPATSEVRDDLWQLDPVDDPEGDLS